MCNTTVQHIKEVLYAGGIWSSNCGIYEREELQSHSKLGGPLKKDSKAAIFYCLITKQCTTKATHQKRLMWKIL